MFPIFGLNFGKNHSGSGVLFRPLPHRKSFPKIELWAVIKAKKLKIWKMRAPTNPKGPSNQFLTNLYMGSISGCFYFVAFNRNW